MHVRDATVPLDSIGASYGRRNRAMCWAITTPLIPEGLAHVPHHRWRRAQVILRPVYVGSFALGGCNLICDFDAAGSGVLAIAAPVSGVWAKLNAPR